MENIRIGEDSVNQEYYDQKLDVCATREIIMRLPFDTGFSNYFMELVQETKYEVDIDITPQLSRTSEIRNELLKLAIDDSKSKASFIADAMDQKIIGIDSVEIGDRYVDYGIDYMCCEQERSVVASNNLYFSNQLKAPTTKESASVEVVWIIE